MRKLETERVIAGLTYTLGLAAGLLLYLVLSGAAHATDKANHMVPVPMTPRQQAASANASAVAGGGQGGGASNYFSERSTSIGVAMASPIPAVVAGCYLPKRGWGRGHRIAFGLLEESAVVERDDQCMADVESARAHELALLKAQADLEIARAARIKAEMSITSVAK